VKIREFPDKGDVKLDQAEEKEEDEEEEEEERTARSVEAPQMD